MKQPPVDSPEVRHALLAAKSLVKAVLALVGVGAYFILMYATSLPELIPGTGKREAFAVIMICFIPAALLHFPLSWWAASTVRRKLHQRVPAPRQ